MTGQRQAEAIETKLAAARSTADKRRILSQPVRDAQALLARHGDGHVD